MWGVVIVTNAAEIVNYCRVACQGISSVCVCVGGGGGGLPPQTQGVKINPEWSKMAWDTTLYSLRRSKLLCVGNIPPTILAHIPMI